jgi:hypothetical protein
MKLPLADTCLQCCNHPMCLLREDHKSTRLALRRSLNREHRVDHRSMPHEQARILVHDRLGSINKDGRGFDQEVDEQFQEGDDVKH